MSINMRQLRWVCASLEPTYVSAVKPHLQNVKAAGVAVDGVDHLALVDEHVVELDGAGRRAARRRRHEHGDLLGAIRVGDVVGAQAAVEEGTEDDAVRAPGGG